MKRVLLIAAAVASVFNLTLAEARATLIAFAFTAIVDHTDPIFGFTQGQTAHGTYTFESTTPGQHFGTVAVYNGAVKSLILQLDGVGMAANTGNGLLEIGDPATFAGSNPGTADYYFIGNGIPMSGLTVGGTLGPAFLFEAFVDLEDRTDTAFSSTALPLTPPDITGFNDRHALRLNFRLVNGGTVASDLTLTSLTVPEPSFATLLGCAAACLFLARRRFG